MMLSEAQFSKSGKRRSDLPVLIPDAHSIASIGIIRSLGRAGYPVHAMSPRPDAIGLQSRYVQHAVVCPPVAHPDFLPWLRRYVRENSIAGVGPAGILEAIRPCFEEFQPLFPISSDFQTVYKTLNKYDVFYRLLNDPGDSRKADNLPPTLLLERVERLREAQLHELDYPAFIKTDAVHSRTGKPSNTISVRDVVEAKARIEQLWYDYERLTVQGFVPGQGAAVAFVIWPNEIRAEFMNLCLHEVPHTGGYCSLRKSWVHVDMAEDARRKIRHLGWRGAAMLEYRYDPATGKFYFIELNARFWAALHVALYAGADLPLLLMDAFFGIPGLPLRFYQRGVRCRFTFPFEVAYVASRLRDTNLPLRKRLWPILEFPLLCLDPTIRADLHFPGDRRLYWKQLGRTLVEIMKK